MLLDNTQLIRGVGVKTPDTQLVRKGLAARGLMGYGDEFRSPEEELTDALWPRRLYSRGTPLVTRRGGLGDYGDEFRSPEEELTDAMLPRRLYSRGTPLVTRRPLFATGQPILTARGFAGLGDPAADPSAPADTTVNTSTLMTAINAEIGYLVNLARAQQGKQPLPDQATAPSVRVGVDTASLKPLLPVLGIGLLALLLLRK